MKYLVITVTFIVIVNNLFAQEKEPVVLQNHSLTATILSPGLQYELKLSDNKSLAINGAIAVNGHYSSYSGLCVSTDPFIQTTYRRYYDRKSVKKPLKHNSGNYYGTFLRYTHDRLGENRVINNSSVSTGFTWGMQRNYKSNLHIGFNTGIGMEYSEYYGFRGHLSAGIQIGFLIK
ncbi:MAG: hypothetical protein AAFQ94_28490 [Bacteroidota bacterium]